MEAVLQDKREGLYMETVEMIHWWLLPLGFALDVLWILWLNSVQKEWPWRSGFWGTVLGAVTLFATVDVVHDPIQSIPYLTGMFIGSVVGVYVKKGRKK